MKINFRKNNENEKNPKVFMILFSLIFLIIGGIMLYKGISTKDKGVTVTATISRIDVETTYRSGERETDHDVYIDYTYNGEKFTNISYPLYTSGMHQGKLIDVKLNPANPTEFYTSTSDILIGAFFAGFAIIFIIITLKANPSTQTKLNDFDTF